MESLLWEVIADNIEGVCVRIDEDCQSAGLPALLGPGSLVRELEISGDELLYELVDGSGPDFGWVSIHKEGTELLIPSQRELPNVELLDWNISKSFAVPNNSLLETQNPSAAGEDTQFENKPHEGVAQEEEEEDKEQHCEFEHGPVLQPVWDRSVNPDPSEPIGDRKMRVLVLHGQQSNENLASFQIMGLKSVLGKEASIRFLEGDVLWEYTEGRDLHDVDQTTRLLAKGKHFLNWFEFVTDDARARPDMFAVQDPAVMVLYKEPEKAVQKLLNLTQQHGPIDVVIGLFEGSLVMHLAIAQILNEGNEIPWRLSVFFGSMPIRDDTYYAPFAEQKAPHPTVHVFGRSDEYYFHCRNGSGKKPAEEYYEKPLVLEHSEGHCLPSKEPCASDIYRRILVEAKFRCGVLEDTPPKVTIPRSPISAPLLDLDRMVPRKMRVLALCGGHSCTALIKHQTAHLRAMLGKHAEWFFVAGTKDWEWYQGEPEVEPMEKTIANGQQLKNWFNDTAHDDTRRSNRDKQFDPNVVVEYHDIPHVVKQLKDHIMLDGPFDVLIGFSQACIMLHLLIGHLRNEAPAGSMRWHHSRNSREQMPWRMTVFFNGMHVRDKSYTHLFDTTSPHPTAHIFGKSDEYYDYARDGFGSRPQEEYYERPLILTHNQGHQFPTEQPRAKEVYERVIAEMWKQCGGKPE